MTPTVAEFDAWYDNGFGVGDWKTARGGDFVKDCVLRLSDDRLTLQKKKATVSCAWGGVAVKAASSDNGNAVLTLTLPGENGGVAKVVVPEDTPNAFWAEVWRIVPSIRERWEQIKPEMLGVTASVTTLMTYLGGYALHPKKSALLVNVELHTFGVSVTSGLRRQRQMFIPWKDIARIEVEGMMDAQRQRSLARTVEFGALGGLAGKKVKSAYLSVATPLGEAIFHTEKMTAPELRARLSAPLASAQTMIAGRDAQSERAAGPNPSPDQDDAVTKLERLAALHVSGALTDDEFAAHKARLLGG
jgi:hypothetical protein